MARYVYNPADFLNAMTPAFDNIIGTITDQVDRISRNREIAHEFAKEQRDRKFQIDVMREGQRFTASEREAGQEFQAEQGEIDRQFRSDEAASTRIQQNRQHEEDWYLKYMEITGRQDKAGRDALDRALKEGMEKAEAAVNEVYKTVHGNGHLDSIVGGGLLPSQLQLQPNPEEPDNPWVYDPVFGNWRTYQSFMADPSWTTSYQMAKTVFGGRNSRDFFDSLAGAEPGQSANMPGSSVPGYVETQGGLQIVTREGAQRLTNVSGLFDRNGDIRTQALATMQSTMMDHAGGALQFVRKDERPELMFDSEIMPLVDSFVNLNDFKLYANTENPSRPERDVMEIILNHPNALILNTRDMPVGNDNIEAKNIGRIESGAHYIKFNVYGGDIRGNASTRRNPNDPEQAFLFSGNATAITTSVENLKKLGMKALIGANERSFVKGLPPIEERRGMYNAHLVKFLKLNPTPNNSYDLTEMFVFDQKAWNEFKGNFTREDGTINTNGIDSYFQGLVQEKMNTIAPTPQNTLSAPRYGW